MKYGIYIGNSAEAVEATERGIMNVLRQLDIMRAIPEVQLAAINALKLEAPQYTTISNCTVNGVSDEDC